MGNDAESIKRAMTYFKRAYESDPSSSTVLNQLANHFFFRGEYKKAQDLAYSALQNTESKKVQAESCYHIGRAYHAKVNSTFLFSISQYRQTNFFFFFYRENMNKPLITIINLRNFGKNFLWLSFV